MQPIQCFSSVWNIQCLVETHALVIKICYKNTINVHYNDVTLDIKHQTFAVLAFCYGNPMVIGGFSSQVTKMQKAFTRHEVILGWKSSAHFSNDYQKYAPQQVGMWSVLTHWGRDKMDAIFQTTFFQMDFLEWKCMNFDNNFIEVCS